MEWEIAVLALVFIIAGVVHGITGFGFPLLATTSTALVLDLKSAVLITLLPTFIINIFSLFQGGQFGVALRKHQCLILFSALGSIAGASLLLWLNQDLLKVFLIFCILFHLFSSTIEKQQAECKPSLLFSASMGLMAGIMGGATNAMSPLLYIYLLPITPSRQEIVQVANACFLLGKLSQAAILLPNYSFADISPWVMVGALVMSFIGMQIGFAMQGKITASVYKKSVKFLLILIMLSLLGQLLYSQI